MAETLDLVLSRLGFDTAPSRDLSGLRAVYRAWCDSVPFDNVRKMIALRTTPDQPLPGTAADDFFEAWLEHGAGATCWPSSNALITLLDGLGFPVRRISGIMRDLGAVNHGSAIVEFDGEEWLVDSSMLFYEPLRLGAETFISPDPVFGAEVEPDESHHIVWFHSPPYAEAFHCRILHDPVDASLYTTKYDESRGRSPFNARLYAKRNRPGEMIVLAGNVHYIKTATGVSERELDGDGVCDALIRDIGMSPKLVEQWAASGSLTDSFQPPVPPPPSTRKAPSKRK